MGVVPFGGYIWRGDSDGAGCIGPGNIDDLDLIRKGKRGLGELLSH